MTIYFPPKVESTRAPFIYTDTSIKIYFTKPAMGYSPTGIEYSVRNGVNNLSVLTIDPGLGHNAFKQAAISTEGDLFYITIPKSSILNGWIANTFYKINLRFYTESITSEWSTSCYVKAINSIAKEIDSGSLSASTVNSETPLFYGRWVCEGELVDRYKFILTNLETDEIEDSGWLIHDKNNAYDTHVFKTALINSKSYTVEYQVKSINNFIDSTSITFLVNITYLTGISFSLEVTPDMEEGVNIVHMEGTLNVAYNYILKRSSIETNYSYWEDIGTFSHETATFSSYFNDFYIKYGIGYKYCLQATNGLIRSSHLAITDSIKNYYEHIYIVSKEKQLKIAFNPQVPSFKNNVETTIVKTLGGQYPIVFRNPNLKYKSLDLRGTISFNLDNMQYFFSRSEAATYLETSEVIGSDNNLNNENIALEFLFREAVLEFLTNSEYKLFKSPTEGFFIAATTDVNLSPRTSLGRAIVDFNCLVTQTEDGNIDNLKIYDILSDTLSSAPVELIYEKRTNLEEE